MNRVNFGSVGVQLPATLRHSRNSDGMIGPTTGPLGLELIGDGDGAPFTEVIGNRMNRQPAGSQSPAARVKLIWNSPTATSPAKSAPEP